MVRQLIEQVPGQHIVLPVDNQAGRDLYVSLGFAPQSEFLGLVVGEWLANRLA